MKPELIALVFMSDDMDNFFIENPPSGPPEKWIDRYVNNIEEVEFVEVYIKGSRHALWANPNCSPEK